MSTLRRRSFHTHRGLTFQGCIEAIHRDKLLEDASYSLDWCIASYNVASTLNVMHGHDDRRVYRAIKDAMAGVQWNLFRQNQRDGRSVHDEEMLKRLYWLIAMWQM